MSDYRVFSFGGGVQSVAVLVLQAQGKLTTPFDEFVFANVGEDSENPDTLDYFAEIVQPLAAAHGITMTTRQKTRFGKPDTVLQAVTRDNRSVPIPVYMPSGSKSNRACTVEFKVRVVDQHIKASHAGKYVEIGIGFSVDETRRLNGREEGWHDRHGKKPYGFWKRFTYPLLELGISRQRCMGLIAEAGLPVPPSSECWFCPFMGRNKRIEQKRHRPDLWAATCEIEDIVNAKRERMGRDRVFLHPGLHPMNQVPDQATMFDTLEDDLACGSGYCGL